MAEGVWEPKMAHTRRSPRRPSINKSFVERLLEGRTPVMPDRVGTMACQQTPVRGAYPRHAGQRMDDGMLTGGSNLVPLERLLETS